MITVLETLLLFVTFPLCIPKFDQKVEKSAHIELFTADLKRRDLEAKKMHYYCENLSTWAIEGYERFVVRFDLLFIHEPFRTNNL